MGFRENGCDINSAKRKMELTKQEIDQQAIKQWHEKTKAEAQAFAREIEEKKRQMQEKRRHKKKALAVTMCVFLAAFIVLFVMSTIQFAGITDMSALKTGIIYKYISFVCGAIILALVVTLKLQKHRLGVLWIFPVIVLGLSLLGADNLTVQDVYCHTDQTVYYEYKNDYKLKRIGDASDVIILSEINGKAVKEAAEFCTSTTQSLTFVGGEWSLSKNDFSNAKMLKNLTIDGSDISVAEKTFENCAQIREVHINNGTLRVSISDDAIAKKDDSWDIFHNSDVSVYLKNGSLINLTDDLKLLDVSGASGVDINLRVSAESGGYGHGTPYFRVEKATFHEDVDFSHAVYKRNAISYWLQTDAYYPISNCIYLSQNTKELPDYFFGEEMDDEIGQIKVYFGGTQEEWNSIIVGNTGNQNFFDGRVSVVYEYKY